MNQQPELFDLSALTARLLKEAPLDPSAQLPVASVAIIINPMDRCGAILLIRRIERSNDPWSGQIGFPGGHKSPIDADFLQTAMRETEEEVGVRLNRSELLGSLPLVTTHSRRLQVAPFVFALKSKKEIHANEEVAEFFWLPLKKLAQLKEVKRTVKAEQGELEVISYDYGGFIVWGLTFRILNLLMGRRV